jgi:hypothetical protein
MPSKADKWQQPVATETPCGKAATLPTLAKLRVCKELANKLDELVRRFVVHELNQSHTAKL